MNGDVVVAEGVVIGAVAVGVLCDSIDWPIDNWVPIEIVYLLVVVLVAGAVSDVRRARRSRRRPW